MNTPYLLFSAHQDACLRRRAPRSTRSAFLLAAVLAWAFSYPAASQELRTPVTSPENAGKAESLNQNLPSKNLAVPATSNAPALDSSSTQRTATEVATGSLISSVAIVPAGQRVSVRIEGKGRLDAQAVRLQNPERLVLDFAATRLALQERVIPSEAAAIRSVRLGQYRPDVARLVIDLTAAIPYEVAHDGSSLVIYLGTQGMNAKPSGGSAAPIAAGRTNPPAGSQPPVATNKIEAQKPPNTQVTVLPRQSTEFSSHPSVLSGKSEVALGSPATTAVVQQPLTQATPDKTQSQVKDPQTPSAATVSATTNSQPAKHILTPFGEINGPTTPSAQASPPSVQGQNPQPNSTTPQQTTVPTKDLAKPPQPAAVPAAAQ